MFRFSNLPSVNVTVIAVALCSGGCATTAPVKFDEGRSVGVALVGAAPIVDFPTPGAEVARAGAATAMGGFISVLSLFLIQPQGLLAAPAIAIGSAKKVDCVNSYYDEHPNLSQEIAGVVDRDFSKRVVIDQFLADLAARSSLKAVVVQNGTSNANLTHEEAVRQAAAAGIDTLFELSPMNVDFDYGGELCAIRPSVRMKYRIGLVNRDQELAAGYEFGKGSSPESDAAGSKTISRWLSDRGSLAKEIEVGYAAAVSKIWYGRRGIRFVLPSPASKPAP